MTRFVIALILLLASQADAEVIGVQSGDHDGFSRLVLSIPSDRAWKLGRENDGYVIETGNISDSFDIRTVFDLIGRNRLAGLDATSQPGRLSLSLACDCHATASKWQADWVIIDIIDGPAAPGSPFETALDPVLAAQRIATITDSSTLDSFAIPQQVQDLADFSLTPQVQIGQDGVPGVILPLVIDGHSDMIFPGSIAENSPVSSANAQASEQAPINAQISATEQSIIESIARAASQGLLDVSVAPTQPPDLQSDSNQLSEMIPGQMDHLQSLGAPIESSQNTVVVKRSALAGFSLQTTPPDQPSITSRTSVDRNAPQDVEADVSSTVGERCLNEALFEMESWGDDRDFSTQIGEKLNALTTEFDIYPEGAIESIAQSYLYFGFGREALQALMLDGIDSQERRVMRAMAYVVDDAPDPSGLLSSQLGCATPAAIWTTLSRGTLDGTSQAERTATIEGLRTLPPMLRGHLGVKLAQIFSNFGDNDTAEMILASARNHITADRTETDLTAVEITLADQGADAAIPELNEVAATNIRLTPEALVQLINLTLDEQQPLDPSLITLADSLLYEHRGEPIGAELIAAQARGLTAAGAYEQAFSLLTGDVKPMEAAQLAALRSAAILSLTERTDDAAFLNFAFDALPETSNAGVENAVATRLLKLGFADRAGALLTSQATGVDARDRRYLQADIAVTLGNYAEVDGYLSGMSDPRAAEIKARALAAQGDFEAAFSVGAAVPGTVPDLSNAWRASEWTLLEQSDDVVLREASDALLAPAEAFDSEAPLAASRALLEQATATQDLAGQLLDRFLVEPALTESGNN